jgi:hypothetical protein
MPLKFLGLRMLAHGSWLGALGVLAFAKMVSVGVTAFIFDVTQPNSCSWPGSDGSTAAWWRAWPGRTD